VCFKNLFKKQLHTLSFYFFGLRNLSWGFKLA